MTSVEVAGPQVDEGLLLELLDLLVSTPSPYGHERELAERLAAHGRTIAPDLTWWVDPFDGDRANLLVSNAPAEYGSVELLLFAHLDTSLVGPDEHNRLYGADEVSSVWSDGLGRSGDLVHGRGVAIAKGPAAGAVVALITAARSAALAPGVAVLLTAGGTHRSGSGGGFASGLTRAIDAGLRPRQAINVKAGAPTVLHEEPGSAYLRLDVTAPGGPAMLRSATGNAGACQILSSLSGPIDAWREVIRSLPVKGTAGREAGIGAIDAGLITKPDMLPSVGRAYVYVIFAPEDDLSELVRHLEHQLVLAGLTGVVKVSVEASMPGGRTDPDHPLITLGRQIWERHFGPAPAVSGWCGSTDGALLRSRGIPVVRLGPRPRSGPGSAEALELSQLRCFAQIDLEMILELAGAERAR